MSIDKKIDYVDQDGYKNYIKNSDSVTVPRKFKARKGAPGTKLAYITDAEAKQLKKQNPGTPHKGPSNIPSYDSFDAEGSYTSGTAMSAAETGSRNERDRAEVRSSNIGGPSGLAPGATSQEAQDLRSAAIAAGAGQRVNPGFFDSRNVISPFDLANARAFSRDPNNLFAGQAMSNRGGGLMGFLTSGGVLGNLVRGLGQRFGLGRTYDQPTYDMSRFSGLPLGGLASFENLDIRDKFDRRGTNMDEVDTVDSVSGIETVMVPMKKPIQPNFPYPGLDQFKYFDDYYDIPMEDNNISTTKVEPNKTYTINELMSYEDTIPTSTYIPPFTP